MGLSILAFLIFVDIGVWAVYSTTFAFVHKCVI